MSGRRAARWLALVLSAGLALGGSCGGGSGGGGSRPVVRVQPALAGCLSLPGAFPPDVVELPGVAGVAAVALFDPPAVLGVDLESEPPAVTAPGPVPALPADSDGDGVDDADALRSLGLPPLSLTPTALHAAADDLVLLAASGIEEVAFLEPVTGALRALEVATPAGLAAGDAPLLPAPGTRARRTAVSTRLCVRPGPGAVDSLGRPVAADCDPAVPSFSTNFTAAVTVAAARMFVATSNFQRVGTTPELLPGTVLVYDLDLAAVPPRVALHATRPVLGTSGFNSTGVTATRTAGGSEVVLVTVTGPVRVGTGPQVALGPSAVDVIDPATLRVVATIPLGDAALAATRLAVDPTGRVAVGGSFAFRRLFAVDLGRLDEVLAVHRDGDPPIVLDGTDARLPFDARIFSASAPFEFPGATDGAPPADCAGAVFGTAFDFAGSKLFATDFCDGLLALVGVDLAGLSTAVPVPRDRFTLIRTEAITKPNDPARFPDAPTAPGPILVRRGRPGVDYRGPDIFALVGLPEGALCGVRVDSP